MYHYDDISRVVISAMKENQPRAEIAFRRQRLDHHEKNEEIFGSIHNRRSRCRPVTHNSPRKGSVKPKGGKNEARNQKLIGKLC